MAVRRQGASRRRHNVRGPVTLLFLVAVLAGAAWFGWRTVLSSATPAAGPACATPSPGTTQQAAAKDITVNVFNAGNREGMATRTARDLERRGFTIGTVGNEPTESRASKAKIVAIRGRDKTAPEVALLAAQVRAKKPLIIADDREDPTVDLVIGNQFTGLAKKAPDTVDVESTAPICKTSSPTPRS